MRIIKIDQSPSHWLNLSEFLVDRSPLKYIDNVDDESAKLLRHVREEEHSGGTPTDDHACECAPRGERALCGRWKDGRGIGGKGGEGGREQSAVGATGRGGRRGRGLPRFLDGLLRLAALRRVAMDLIH